MLSRRRKTITGKSALKHTPKIKPVKARRIIRRFHLLINKRRVICDILKCKIVENDEETNLLNVKEYLKRKPYLKSDYDIGFQSVRPNQDLEDKLIKIQTVDNYNTLCRVLGYIFGEIHDQGGLQHYQLASTVGQDVNRGGDSSKLLIEWCRELGIHKSNNLNALEIGSLSASNRISTSGIFNPVTRIDLNSNDKLNIQQQDFMQRPIPQEDNERFDLISCSLVLNFVPTPTQRGEMLLRFQDFFKASKKTTYLFLVLPLPCVANSRYMDKDTFRSILETLGYKQIRYREAKKLAYWLFEFNTSDKGKLDHRELSSYYKKTKLSDKPNMNNFSIVLPHS